MAAFDYNRAMRPLLKRWWFWLALFGVLLAFASLILPDPGQGPINRANFDRIKLGMTMDDVRKILGEEQAVAFGDTRKESITWHYWANHSEDVVYEVVTGNGKVKDKAYRTGVPPEWRRRPTVWQRLKAALQRFGIRIN
jgi:hypothetical protein